MELVKSSIAETDTLVLPVFCFRTLIILKPITIPTVATLEITTRSDTEVDKIHSRKPIFDRFQKDFSILGETIVIKTTIHTTTFTVTNRSFVVFRHTNISRIIVIFLLFGYRILVAFTISQEDYIDLLKFILCLKVRNQRVKRHNAFTDRRTRQVKMTRNSTPTFLKSITSSPDILELLFQNTIIRFAGEKVHQTE